MHFLNPVALIGLLAAAIPVAIHLLHRGRSRPVPFSNLQLLRALHQTRMRRLQLRQWLILALRTLAILCIVLAFARPALRRGGPGLLGGSTRLSAVLLLDGSFSTRYEVAGRRTFDRLEAVALQLLDLFGEGDQVHLVPFDRAPRPPLANPDPETVTELAPSADVTRLEAALTQASVLLDAAPPGYHRELFLLSDLTRYGWPTQVPADSGGWRPDMQVYLLAPDTHVATNRAVTELGVDAWLQSEGEHLDVRARVDNHSDAPARIGASLYVDGVRVQRREAAVPPRGHAAVDLALSPRRRGRLPAYVEIDGDGLPLDDRRYFVLHIPERARALVLGPDPVDTYFARTALAAAAGADPVLELRSGLLADLGGTILDSIDVLYLCNVPRLDRERTRLVHAFAERGGGLVLFPGPDADLPYYNRQLLPGLLPASLVEVMGSPDPTAPSAASLDLTAPRHPLLEGLAAADPPALRALFRLTPIRPLARLLGTADGRLVAAEGWVRPGRVTLFAVPLDLAWSDLPLDGRFAPVMHRLARRSVLPPGHGVSYSVGERVRRHVPRTVPEHALQVESPSGRRRYMEPQHLDARLYWAVDTVDEPGIWQVRRGDEVIDMFAVNVAPEESDLRRADSAAVERFFGTNRVKWLTEGGDLASAVEQLRYGRELWRELLLATLALLLLELWLARAPDRSTDAP